jgi:hypothetical protein
MELHPREVPMANQFGPQPQAVLLRHKMSEEGSSKKIRAFSESSRLTFSKASLLQRLLKIVKTHPFHFHYVPVFRFGKWYEPNQMVA